MDDKVVHLADRAADALQWTPDGMLYDARISANGEYKHIKKAIVIFYDEENPDNRKRIRWIQSGMKRSEVINLLSLAKDDLIQDMFESLLEG